MNVKGAIFFIVCALFWSLSHSHLTSEEHFVSLITLHENIMAMKCILNIMRTQIPCSTVVTLVFSNDDVNYLVETIHKSGCYTLIVRSFNDNNWLIKTNAYVIVTENVQELEMGMSLITFDSFWNPRARIIAHAHDIKDDEINDVFNIFMKYRTYDVIFITNGEISNDAEVFTYFPFENESCGKRFDDAKLISYCNDLSGVKDFFPNKYSNRMKNCTVGVVVNQDIPNIIIKTKNNQTTISGLENYILENVAQTEGFNLKYEIASKRAALGVVLPNHTATGSLALLQSDIVDIAAGGYVLIENRANIFDYIYGFNFATYNLYTPCPDEPVWMLLYEGFDELTWVLLLATFVIFTILSIIVINLIEKIQIGPTNTALKLWGFLYIGNSSPRLLKITKLRMIIMCWIWFTFFMSNFYSTALYSLITANVEVERHIGPENLYYLPLRPCVGNYIRELFQFAYNQTLPPNEPLEACLRGKTALDTIANRTDLYTIEMSYTYDILEYKYLNEHGLRKIDTWRFSADNILTIHMARGFPLRDKMQEVSFKLYEGGFLKYQSDEKLRKSRSAARNKPKIFRNVRLSDLKYHYYILIIGLVISTVCFFTEMSKQKPSITTDSIS